MLSKEKGLPTLHPNEIMLIASRATLGHSVSPEEYQQTLDGYSRLLADSMNHPKKKEALHLQYQRQQEFVRRTFHPTPEVS